jgi:PAS domain S-box-containing protein
LADTFKSGISRKGAIMVAVPLVIELFLLSVLYVQLNETEKQRHLAEHQSNIRAQGDLVIEMFYDAATSLMSFATNTKSPEGQHYPDIVHRLPGELNRLAAMAENEDEKIQMEKIKPPLMRGVKLLQELEKSIGEADSDLTALLRMKERLPDIASVIFDLKGELSTLLMPVFQKTRDAPQLEQEAVKKTLLFVEIGALSSVLVALLVAFFFSKEIVDRLKTISDNSIKISLNEPLNPPVGGHDEITSLDTRVRLMAARLIEARRKESAILENALDVICSIDKANRITSINPACFAIWGFYQDELLGKNVLELVSEPNRKSMLAALAGHKANPVMSFEVTVNTSSGQGKEMRWSANYSDGEDSWFCVVHDISAAKEVERLKQQFVAMVSHDLRTPLNSLLNLLTLLSENVYGELSQTGHKRVAAVEREIGRLIKLINELLELEKLEAGQELLDRRPVLVADIADASIDAVEGFASSHKIQLVNDCRSRATLHADKDRLTQVFVNLLSNAIKFSPQGTSVMLRCEDLTDGKGRFTVRVSVEDHGCGIAEDKMVSIFERFTQVDGPQKASGTGLGLAIAKAIVGQHKGRIGVESTVGKGSVFWVELGAGQSASG